MSIQFIQPIGSYFPTNHYDMIKNYPHVTQTNSESNSNRSSITTDTSSQHSQDYSDLLPDDFCKRDSSPSPLTPVSTSYFITNTPTSSESAMPMSITHRLSINDFVIKQTVGIGSTARVHLAKSKINEQYYAIKAINKKGLNNKRQITHVEDERRIHSMLDHPFLVKLWGTFQTNTHLFFVMDYVPGGELFTIIRDRKLTENEAKFYAAEVLLGIDYLHGLNIAYRDLKPENILLDHRGHVKITDFGFSKVVSDVTWTICGTPDYLAPEIIFNKGHSKAIDWWSFGVLIYEMITGQSPFHAENPIDQYQRILECDISWPDFISPEAKDLIQGLLRVNPSERLGADDIKNHIWFKSLDFDDVYAREITPPIIPDIKFNGDTHCFDYYEEIKVPYNLKEASINYCKLFPNF